LKDQEKLFDGKNTTSKISCYCPFTVAVVFISICPYNLFIKGTDVIQHKFISAENFSRHNADIYFVALLIKATVA